eukprot:16428271-Heterocapsa_arctica.AAC.1
MGRQRHPAIQASRGTARLHSVYPAVAGKPQPTLSKGIGRSPQLGNDSVPAADRRMMQARP